ncbi:MAG: response regulator transcription factor [Bacteroidota bacterium]
MHALPYSSEATKIARSRILIVDDHPLVRQGIAQFINQEKDLQVCGEASDGHEALRVIDDLNPDLVVVDIEMKGLSGLELVRSMKTHHPKIPVLMLSMHDENLYAERALRAGARGYLMKEEDPEKVVQAIRVVLNGDVYASDKATSKILKLLSDSKTTDQGTSVDRLSDRELEVFRMIGDGYRTRHIASKLILSAKTVESYKARLKQKLMLKDAAELARYAAEWVKSS